MKKSIVLLLIVAFFANVTPIFAAEKTIFQIASDSIEKDTKGKSLGMETPEVKVFQQMCNYIDTGSKKAKQCSLRQNRQEHARRMGRAK